jgi:hypothetical protein
MKNTSLRLIYKTLLISCLITTFSCKKMFDVAPQDQVDITNNYRNVYDANAAVIGIYGKLMGVADKYIVLNELRADLMSPTNNADQYLKQLNEHAETTDNPWIDPRPWYNIILNCNDAMKNFDIMIQTGKMTNDDYQQRYSDVGAIRSWVYLQLGIQFGSVPYVTDALSSVDDLKDETKYPKITFDQLLDKLIAFMGDGKRFLDFYSTASSVTGATNTSLSTTVDAYSTNLFFINKHCLLGDLYLWKGNYTQAAINYKYMAEYGFRTVANTSASNKYEQYNVNYTEFNVSYTNAQDERSLVYSAVDGWQSMFSRPSQDTPANAEWMWVLPFDKNFLPVDPFINLFSNQGGSYLLTASKLAMDNWNLPNQTQRNGFPYDQRGRLTVRTINGQPVIVKQLYNYLNISSLLPINILQKQGRWILYRTGTLQLHYAEAACNDNQVKVAYALTNVGVHDVFAPYYPNPIPSSFDPTNSEQTFLPAPYDMDARAGGAQNYHSAWYKEVGTRTRANLTPLPTALYTTNDKIGMENAIIDEDGLELAYEGYRWGDLLRVARRRNDPSFLAEKVYQKLLRDGNPNAATVRAKLMNPANWYLPFKM